MFWSNKRQPEADFLHSWAAILNIYLVKSFIKCVKTLSNTNLAASRHIKREKTHFRLSCVAQKRCYINFLLSGSHSLCQALGQWRRAKKVSEQWKTSEREKGRACIPQSANYQKYCFSFRKVKICGVGGFHTLARFVWLCARGGKWLTCVLTLTVKTDQPWDTRSRYIGMIRCMENNAERLYFRVSL